jgi:hypothetical protein
MSAARGEGKQGRTAQEAILLTSCPYTMVLEMAKHTKKKQKGVDKRGETAAAKMNHCFFAWWVTLGHF